MAALQAQENEIASNFVVFLFSGFLLLSGLVLCFALQYTSGQIFLYRYGVSCPKCVRLGIFWSRGFSVVWITINEIY